MMTTIMCSFFRCCYSSQSSSSSTTGKSKSSFRRGGRRGNERGRRKQRTKTKAASQHPPTVSDCVVCFGRGREIIGLFSPRISLFFIPEKRLIFFPKNLSATTHSKNNNNMRRPRKNPHPQRAVNARTVLVVKGKERGRRRRGRRTGVVFEDS